MKFEIQLNADTIREAIEEADGEGCENATLYIYGEIGSNKKAKVLRVDLWGECINEYIKTIIRNE
jgi:hypothetical protein